jgi:hypothetical protein
VRRTSTRRLFQNCAPTTSCSSTRLTLLRAGSDLEYLFRSVLPDLSEGVWVHLHDIFFPFEYPESWVLEGRSWNEVYFLRSFLQYNDSFAIKFFSDFLRQRHFDLVSSKMPLWGRNAGGNIWPRKER